MAQLEIDGEKICTTDASWDYLDGPVVSAEIYNGEIFDTTLNDTAWSTAEAPVEVAGKAEEIQYTTARLIAPDVAPIRRILEIKPKEIITTPEGKKILDKGDEVVIRHAEVLEHGELGTRPLRTAKAQNIVKLGGKTKGYKPRFSWFGFRYAEITGYDDLSLLDFVAVAISTDLRQTGTFDCSHEMIKKLHENTIWSTRDNFVSVPTDCPQRDERLGWTGDIQVFAPTANYLFDTTAFLSNWLQDLEADQPRPMAIWADCSVITPWDLYTSFGDKQILQRQWGSMRMWLDTGLPRNKQGFYSTETPQYGDWLDPRSPPQLPGHSPTDPYLVANAYLIYTTRLAARIGHILGHTKQAATDERDANRLTEAFRTEYIAQSGRLLSILTRYANGTINPGQMTSFNHYALGSVCAFLHKTIGGLSPLLPGWKKALVSPKPGGTIRHATTSFDSPYGPYAVSWKLEDTKLKVSVKVPPNGEAEVVLKNVHETVGSGEHTFEDEWEEDNTWPLEAIQGAQGNVVEAHFVP
ncbi:hypothetical protein KVT40_001781 [Elsinoe batatas]|uniref:alpha-L-rhamnosidase n=1 Tax=Elsinoe batatas TaxID=2601811 RepID=A0A8K0L738_9PEZI|nr:hypothetical protein KVT40_001781 [Elsinoe batatas]